MARLPPEEWEEIEREIAEGAPFRRVLRHLLETRRISLSERELLSLLDDVFTRDVASIGAGLALLALDIPRQALPFLYFLLESFASVGARSLLPRLLSPLGAAETAHILLEIREAGFLNESEASFVLEAIFGTEAATTYLEGK